jgi:hypothetical protein
LRRRWISLYLGDSPYSQVGTSVTEATPCSVALDRLNLDFNDRHTQLPRFYHLRQLERTVCLDVHTKTEPPSMAGEDVFDYGAYR